MGEGLKAVFVQPDNGVLPLTVQGSANHVNELNKEDIQLYVDISNLPPGEHKSSRIEQSANFYFDKSGDRIIKHRHTH